MWPKGSRFQRTSFRDRSYKMSTLSLRLPNSLHEQIRQLAKREGISINQFIASATAEKMTALLTEEYLSKRAQRASRKKFQAVLNKVPDVEPESYDKL
ncbi:MAG: YlcI/YnfO family protein [Desulfobacterales bacterium]